MDKLEKAIKKIEECFRNEHNGFCRIKSSLLWYIRELLKERQPRVLTFDEAIQSEYEVLVEIYSPISEKTYIKWCDLCYDGNMSLAMYTTHGIQLISEESYNRRWRVWSDRPTDEQRKAVPWKDGDGE